MGKTKILLIEDDESYVDGLRLLLQSDSIEIVWAASAAEGIQAYRKNIHGFATVVIDYLLPDQNGSVVAPHLRKLNPEQDILFASGHNDPSYLIDLLETGCARSFIVKGRAPEETRQRILESIAIYQNKNRVIGKDDHSPSQIERLLNAAGFIGCSQAQLKILEQIKRCREQNYSVALIGETGSGKGKIAKALVTAGKEMTTVLCGRYSGSENMLESELFGHKKGAFTGAVEDTRGLILEAHDQFLFLDELQDLSGTAQRKMLRLLDEMKFRRVGDDRGGEISVRFKLISAMKPAVYKMIKEEQFLEDLYNRVAHLEIHIPPLRERPEDIEPMVRHIQNEFNEKRPETSHKQIRSSTISEMKKYPWMGNLRQLQNAVRQMLTAADRDIVNPSAFDDYLKNRANHGQSTVALKEAPIAVSVQRHEIEQIIGTLKTSRTQNETAEKLGLNRFQLLRKLKRLGIDAESYLRHESLKPQGAL
jgi:two-component system nitrogen regulation response regulator NtrX